LARGALSHQRVALGTLLEEGFERLRETGEHMAEHLRLLRRTVQPNESTADPSRAAALNESTPRPSSPSLR
jgi:hypothetical protein